MNLKSFITSCALIISANVFSQFAGNLDMTFGSAGKVVTSITTGQDKGFGVALQADGKIVVVGYSSGATTGKDFVVIRYNSDGTLDNAFGNNGITTTDVQTGSDDIAYSLAIQTDGKIILAGYSDNGSNKDAAMVRYNTNGSIDNSFGTNGIVLTDFDNLKQDEIRVVKVHALTGNIIVGGSAVITTTASKPVIARYSANGVLDNTFNSNGIRLLWITANDYQYIFAVEDLEVQTNGRIVAVGWRDYPGIQWSADYWAARINSNGTMDNTFSSDGVNVYNGSFNGNDKAYSLLLETNNNIIVAGAGYLSTLKYDYTLFEINASGTTTSWAGMADWGSTLDDIAYALELDNNGKFVLAGSSGVSTSKTFAVARFESNATLDLTFGSAGKVTTTFGTNLLNECFDAVVQTDNKIVAVGYTGGDLAIARYLGTDIPTGIRENASSELKIYPNPVTDFINIDATLPGANKNFKIFNIMGTEILSGKITAKQTIIKSEQFPAGIYYIQIEGLPQNSFKFLKQ